MAGEENSTVGNGKVYNRWKKLFPHLFLQKNPYCAKNIWYFLECVFQRGNSVESFVKISEKNFHCSQFDILLNWIIKSILNSENDTGLIFEKESITISYKYVKTFPINVLKMWKGKKDKKVAKTLKLDWLIWCFHFLPPHLENV